MVAGRIDQPGERIPLGHGIGTQKQIHRCDNPSGQVQPVQTAGIPLEEGLPNVIQAIAGNQKEQYIAGAAAVGQCFDGIDTGVMGVGNQAGSQRSEKIDKYNHGFTS